MKIKLLDFSTGKSYFCGEFSHLLNKMQPLAERMRPKSLEDYVGQQHLIGDGAVLRRMIDSGKISSFILWGPPGVGKTTLAGIIAELAGNLLGLGWAVTLARLYLIYKGMMNALEGRAEPLPWIGNLLK